MSEALSLILSDEIKPQSDTVLATPTSNRLPLSPINCDNLLTDSQDELLLNEFNLQQLNNQQNVINTTARLISICNFSLLYEHD